MSSSARRQVLVTGASGHVGANLVRALCTLGYPVRAFVHVDTGPLRDLEVELVRGDVLESASLLAAFRGVDVVFHCAGQISISRSSISTIQRVNAEGTANVVQACMESGVRRLVHFSSIHAISDPGPGAVINETSPLAAESEVLPYDASKARAERIVAEAVGRGLDAVVVVPTAIIGPYDYRPSYFGRVLLAIAHGRMPVLVQGGFDLVDVRDVVAAAVTAAEWAPPGARYLLSGHWCSLADIAQYVGEARARRAPRLCIPGSVARFCSPMNEALCRIRGKNTLFTRYAVESLFRHRHVSHECATTDLAYEPRPLRQTIADTVLWFQEHGYLLPREGRERTAL